MPHLGCPGACLFCNQTRITGQQEAMTPERAKEIIETSLQNRQKGEYWEIGFFGGSFTGIPEKEQEALLKVAQEAVRAGLADGIRLSTRPDYINESVLERLVFYGVTTVELGAQSMDDAVLAANRRGHTARQTRKAAEAILAKGLHLGLQMMIGLPKDTPEKAMKTAEAFAAMKAECVRIYPTLVIRGTGLADLYEKGEYAPLTVDEAVSQCATLYGYFTEQNIDVIRMGLLEMPADDVLAGPFHPAFGELVMSAACYEELFAKLQNFKGDALQISVNPRYVSVFLGQGRKNIKKITEVLSLRSLEVIQDETVPWGKTKVTQI